MPQRTRILVADRDLNTLSRIYLALLHRNYKVEATNLTEEIAARTKRLKPSLIILGYEEFEATKKNLKTPAIVLCNEEHEALENISNDVICLEKNVAVDKLISTIEELIY